VLLKQPVVPTGAPGCGFLSELAPAVWQMAHTAALLVSVEVWVRAPVEPMSRQGEGEWGDDIVAP
jgi:hypothetical protein